ncbi:MAG: ActS/PrrB/RegB family redox-sensitive histidine kinase [Alphaproteobacteria bacterium]
MIDTPSPSSELSEHTDIRPAVKTRRAGGINGRTLAMIRWVAVGGQLTALGIVQFVLDYPLPVWECLICVFALAISNVVLSRGRHWRSRLPNYHAARLLTFDMAEISALLYFTGGLSNPFSPLILVPVTVSAAILSRGATIMLTIFSLFGISVLAVFHQPLPWSESLELPIIYRLALWTALAVSLIFMAAFVWSVADESRRREQALAETEAALAREQRLSALGGLAAAAAHELGSPLNTISLIAKDLPKELPPDDPLQQDLTDLVEQVDRCRDILQSLSRRPETEGGQPYDILPLTDLAEESAKNHIGADKEFLLTVDETSDGPEPMLARSPELLHGLGNLVQNAGQFARKRVDMSLFWTEDNVTITITDDGPGFPVWLLDSLGEPYLSTQSGKQGHMGLGIFIAQTLLDRVGARVRYRNRKPTGAMVQVRIPLRMDGLANKA